MSVAQAPIDIEYPETDGMPMGETDVHRAWMIRIYDLLRRHYAAQRVYVGCNLLVYYAEGIPRQFCVPDVFVVKDCDPAPRRVFKVWEEGQAPDVVFEVTSRGTRREDEIFKPQVYGRIGVKEYFLYDPTAEYLSPPLQGHRLDGERDELVRPGPAGALDCRELGLKLWLDAGKLVLADAATGERLLTDAEAAEARAEGAEARAEGAEARAEGAEARAEGAEARAQAAEEEARRLREQLARLQQPPQP